MVETCFFFCLNVRKCRNSRIYILEVRLVSEKPAELYSPYDLDMSSIYMFYTICAPGRDGSVQKVAPNPAFGRVGAVEPLM